MRCPYCGNDDTQVKDSRPTEDSGAIRRRREVGETSLALAAESGHTKRNINLIVSRQRWAHVAD